MPANPFLPVLRRVRKQLGLEGPAGSADAQLLQRFVRASDEAAFAALVERHGALVWSVCRRVTRDGHAAEDAFQATWLVLARKAASLRDGAALPAWLHRVALRLALAARARPGLPLEEAAARGAGPEDEAARREAQAAVDEEVNRLPEKYRLPVVLCYLEGHTHAQAAAELGWPLGTVAGRVARARALLQARLTRRGLAPALPPVPMESGTVPPVATPAGGAAVVLAAALADGSRWRVAVGLLLVLVPSLAVLLPVPPAPSTPQSVPPPAFVAAPVPLPAPLVLPVPRRRVAAAVASLSPDGKLLATGEGKEIRLSDPATGVVLRQLAGQTEQVASVRFSPDGQALAAVGVGGQVRVWDVRSGKERFPPRRCEGWRALCFSPDGRLLALSEGDRGESLRTLDVTTGAVQTAPGKQRDPVAAVAFSPDGRTLASVRADRVVRLLDLTADEERGGDTLPPGDAPCLAFRPHGEPLLAAGGGRAVLLLDGKTGRQVAALEGHAEPVKLVAFSPDGRTLAAVERQAVVVWGVAGRKERWRWAEVEVASAAFSADGQWLATAGRGGLRLWDVAAGTERADLEGHRNAAAVFFSPDGGTLFAVGDGLVRLWDVAAGREQGAFAGATALCFSPDGTTLASAGGYRVLLRDRATGRVRAVFDGDRCSAHSVRFSPDGKLLAAGHSGGRLRLYDVAARREVAALAGHTDTVHDVCFSPDGRTLASADGDGTARLWDVATGRELAVLKQDESLAQRTAVCFSPDGKTLFAASRVGRVTAWDAATGKERATFRSFDRIESMRLSPDGRTAATGEWGGVRLWDPATGDKLAWFPCPRMCGVAFSPDGKTLAAAGWDRTLKLWDVVTRREKETLPGHTHNVLAVAFSPDGTTLASGSEDSTTLLWDVSPAE